MALQTDLCISLTMAISISLFCWCFGFRYRVGDSVWSIPQSPDFYSNWSSSVVFYIGDSLVFEFESEFFNVIQVTRQDYDSCTTWNAMKILTVSPAIIILHEEGVFYYICNISNYCDLGQKITIVVHKHSINYSAPPTPSPAPLLPFPSPEYSPGPSNKIAPSPYVVNVTSNQRSAGNRKSMAFIYNYIIFVSCLGILFVHSLF